MGSNTDFWLPGIDIIANRGEYHKTDNGQDASPWLFLVNKILTPYNFLGLASGIGSENR